MTVKDQGLNKSRYKVVPRTLIFIFKDREVLLLSGASNKSIWPNVYNGLGGHIEYGESVIQSAKREIFEEAGLEDISLWICGNIIINTSDEDTGILLFVLKGEYNSGQLRDSVEGNLCWVNIENISSLNVVEDLPLILPYVYKHHLNEPIFSAISSYDESGQLVLEILKSP